uniref:Uncharacterized protein n=1 Tax=Acrobeloides nanus TaxID=290746 RepID=A0A914DF50_9BILA
MESCKGRIGTLDTFLSKKVNIKRNSDCPIHHITLRNGETEGEIAWTIDLSGFLVKSIYVKLANLIDHCIVDAFVSFASKRFSIPNEKGEITIKESPMHGNYLEVRAKIIAKEGAFFSISNEFGKNCISIVKNNVPNLAIIVEFY